MNCCKLITFVVSAICGITFAGDNLLVNGNFDSSKFVGDKLYSYVSSGAEVTGWTLSPQNGGLDKGRFLHTDTQCGIYAMFLQGEIYAEQAFTVKETGTYRYSFVYAGRGDVYSDGTPFNILLLNSNDTVTTLTNVTQWARGVWMPCLGTFKIFTPGTYKFRIDIPKPNGDRMNIFDDVAITKVEDDELVTNLLRNPQFEDGSIEGAYGYMDRATTKNPYWMASLPSSAGLVTRKGTFLGRNEDLANCGRYALYFQRHSTTSADVYVEQEFAVMEVGEYRWSLLYAGRNYSQGGTGFQTSLISSDGTETILTNVAESAVVKARWKPCFGTVEITTPGMYKFRVKFLPPAASDYDRSNCFDNMVFARMESDNLISNGTFDEGVVPTDVNCGNYGYSTATGYLNPHWTSSSPKSVGLCVPGGPFVASGLDVGNYAMYLQIKTVNTDVTVAEQSFTVSETGMYELSFNYTARQEYIGYGGLPLVVNIVTTDGIVLNTPVSLAIKDTFLHSSISTVRLDPGTYKLQFVVPSVSVEDCGSEFLDRTAVVDDVVLKKISSTAIYSAVWTGAAGDGDASNNENWECRYADDTVAVGKLPTVDTIVTFANSVSFNITSESPLLSKAIVFSNAKLSNDCDWTGLKNIAAITGTLDLNGRTLVVSRLDGTYTITGTTGELVVKVESGTMLNKGVAISGGVSVRKTGAGTFVSAKIQEYVGGTVADAGTIQPPDGTGENTTYSYDQFKAFGTGVITINHGATFDLRGNYAYRTHIDLEGGTLRNTGYDMTKANFGGSGFGNLTANSVLDVANSIIFGDFGDNNAVNLGGFTLDVTIAANKKLYMKSSYVTNGTVKVSGGGLFATGNLDMSDATLDISCAIDIETDKTLAVKNYISRYAGNGNGSSGTMTVSGMFTPVADGFWGCKMLNGSTIDVSNKADVLALGDVFFDDNATVCLELGERRLRTGTKIIGWEEGCEPLNLSTLKFKTSDGMACEKRSDGIYKRGPGFVIILQ